MRQHKEQTEQQLHDMKEQAQQQLHDIEQQKVLTALCHIRQQKRENKTTASCHEATEW